MQRHEHGECVSAGASMASARDGSRRLESAVMIGLPRSSPNQCPRSRVSSVDAASGEVGLSTRCHRLPLQCYQLASVHRQAQPQCNPLRALDGMHLNNCEATKGGEDKWGEGDDQNRYEGMGKCGQCTQPYSKQSVAMILWTALWQERRNDPTTTREGKEKEKKKRRFFFLAV